jgi:hypothetical protein
MKKVFEAFAKQKNSGAATYKFLHDGNRIQADDTADTVRACTSRGRAKAERGGLHMRAASETCAWEG